MKRPIRSLIRMICISLFALILTQNAFAQYSLSVDKRTVKQAVRALERNSGYSFFFTDELPGLGKQITVKADNESVESILNKVLAGTDIAYRIQSDNQVVLYEKVPEASNDKNITVKGVVSDTHGRPMVGVTIFAADGKTGAVTDVNGSYSITTEPGMSLTFSYLGYVTRTIAVHQNRTLDVALEEDINVLDDIVVIGYGEMRRADITTAVSVVTTKDLDERPIINAGQMIQGRAAGVQVVQPSGMPGEGMNIRIRGFTSIEASNDPLYVVDGLVTDNISYLSPADIESMQILKDASSAAIYGARAANGVVIITTKRGQSGVANVKFSSYVGISQLGNKIDALNNAEYKDLMRDMYEAGNRTVPNQQEFFDDMTDTNWSDVLFKTGVNQNYQLSVSNGSDKIQYYVSAGHVNDKGIVNKANYKRTNLRANIDAQQTDWLKMGLNVAYSNSTGSRVRHNSSSMRAGSILSVVNTPPIMQVWDPEDPKRYHERVYGIRLLNPMAANARDNFYDTDRFNGALSLEVNPVKGLTARTSFSVDYYYTIADGYLDPFSTTDGTATNGEVSEEWEKNYEWSWDNTITYQNTFGLHNFSVMAGAIMSHAQYSAFGATGTNLPTTNSEWLQIHSISVANNFEPWNPWAYRSAFALASFLGRVTYDYDSKYLLTANFRADGSSKFRPDARWGYFPSVSAGWRISGESFMDNTRDVVDDLKIRVAWGKNGNQSGMGNYPYLTFLGTERNPPTDENPDNELSVSGMTSIPNDRVTWETTTQWNAGIDASFFNSRLMLSVDAYYKKTTDVLLTVYMPSTVNRPSGMVSNDGVMENKGLEFLIQSRNLTGEFKWNTDFNMSFNRNKILETGPFMRVRYSGSTYSTGEPITKMAAGLPLGAFFGYVSQGVDPLTGDMMYEDLNDDYMIDSSDRKIIGYAQPKFTYGFTNDFSYRGFALSIFFQGSYGNQIFNASRIETEGMFDFRNQSKAVLRRWQRPGQETDIPRISGDDEWNYHNSSRFVEDGSYLRLKSLTLSYNFSGKWMRKAKIARLQPYFTAHNLLTFTKYSGYDPEVSAYGSSPIVQGVDYGTYPQNKTFVFGVNIEF